MTELYVTLFKEISEGLASRLHVKYNSSLGEQELFTREIRESGNRSLLYFGSSVFLGSDVQGKKNLIDNYVSLSNREGRFSVDELEAILRS